MRKEVKEIYEIYRYSRLYYDEIKEIIEIFEELDDSFELNINNYILDSIQDIKEFENKKITELNIRSIKTTFSFNFKEGKISIYLTDVSTSLGAFYKINKILRKYNRSIIRFFRNPVLMCLSTTLFVFIGLLNFRIKSYPKTLIIISLLFYFVSAIYFFVNLILSSKNIGSVIYLKSHEKMPSFFKRQKDNILLSLFSVIFGSAITLFFQYIFKLISS